ncbi:MAG: squalene--hopene cyclase [Planctomycetaceae bacterium]
MRSLTLLVSIAALLPAATVAQDPELRFGDDVPRDVELIYERGLQWLIDNQLENGGWDGAEYGRGGGGSGNSGITGMCVMVFLASGEDPNYGKYSTYIRKALRNIIRGQDSSTGYLPASMYHHGFGMLGLSEAYGAVDDELLWQGEPDAENQRSIGEALELAVRCSITAQKQNQWGGWRYSPTSRDADTSVSGAVMMGLLAARNAGIRIPDEAMDKGLDYFRKMTSDRGGVGYSGGVGGLGGSKNLQAIATLVYAIGHRKDLKEYKGVLNQVMLNIEHDEPSYPFYFRYYMAQALFQGDFESWQKWNQRTIRQLKDLQSDDGSFTSQHGQAYGTSMSLLALALNYRFLPIYER